MPHRQAYRARVRIPATCRTDDGVEHGTSVVDLSEDGCRLRDGIDALDPGMGLSIAIGNMAPVSAQVQWRYRSFAGIAFTRPLAGALVDHLQHHHARGPLPHDPISVQ